MQQLCNNFTPLLLLLPLLTLPDSASTIPVLLNESSHTNIIAYMSPPLPCYFLASPALESFLYDLLSHWPQLSVVPLTKVMSKKGVSRGHQRHNAKATSTPPQTLCLCQPSMWDTQAGKAPVTSHQSLLYYLSSTLSGSE